MITRIHRDWRAVPFMLGIALIAGLGTAYALKTVDLAAGLICGFLIIGLALFLYERIFPLGARVLYKTRIAVRVPGTTKIEFLPESSFRVGRIFLVFDRSKAFFNGTVIAGTQNLQLAKKSLPVIEQFQVRTLGTYNRALVRDSDRVYLDIANCTDGLKPVTVELRLGHNVTNPKLKEKLDVKDLVEVEVVFKAI